MTRAPRRSASRTSRSGDARERRRDGGRIAQRLRRDPVLAVAAVQIAAEHAEAVGERAGIRVEERLLLDRIALHAADVAPRHAQPAALVEAHLADADRALGQRTAVAAGVAAQAAVAAARRRARPRAFRARAPQPVWTSTWPRSSITSTVERDLNLTLNHSRGTPVETLTRRSSCRSIVLAVFLSVARADAERGNSSGLFTSDAVSRRDRGERRLADSRRTDLSRRQRSTIRPARPCSSTGTSMVRTGVYHGVPLYADATLEPVQHRLRADRPERHAALRAPPRGRARRDGRESRAPSFPIQRDGDLSVRSQPGASQALPVRMR